MTRQPHSNLRTRQTGTALFISLILLLVLTVIGVTAARLQTVEERMSQNQNNQQLAMESAEAALRQSEQAVIAQAPWATNFAANAGGTYDLLAEIAGAGSIVDQAGWTASAIAYNGPAMASVPVAPPSMVIEQLPTVTGAGDPMATSMYQMQPKTVARVTVNATGGDVSGSVTLQSIVQN
jgi:type IV pilus assembly protein PilX